MKKSIFKQSFFLFFKVDLVQDLSLMFFESLISDVGYDVTPKLEAISGLVEAGGRNFAAETKLVSNRQRMGLNFPSGLGPIFPLFSLISCNWTFLRM
jgi:hypothetical protein